LAQFVRHAGLAFGIFHRYVYDAFKAGDLNDPAHHKPALQKAGAASMAAFAQVLAAKQAAQGATGLRELFAPLAAFQATLNNLAVGLNQGHLDRFDIQSGNGTVANIKQSALSAGVNIVESAPASAP
jgi:hypothetical protein